MDANKVRLDFPLFDAPEDERIVYMDNACMTLKPRAVIEAITEYYTEYPACGERSVHRLSNRVTLAVDDARRTLARFVGAPDDGHVAFTKNTTEAINQVCWGIPLSKGDVVLTSDKEHNSNLIPWQRRARAHGIRHDWFATDEVGAFDDEAFKAKVSEHRGKLRLVSVLHTSNLDGQTNPIREMVEIVHDAGARILVDAAQSVPHLPVDVAALDVDFLAWSIHKMMGPTGVGCLYGTDDAMRALDPIQLGGNTVADSTLDGHETLDPPHSLEAGLQNYAGIIGAGAAARYLTSIGLDEIHEHEASLNARLTKGLLNVGATIHGPQDAALRGGIVPFTLPPLDSHDVALYLDEAARIAVRSGSHCVHAFLNARGIEGWARASLYAYNTAAECDLLVEQVGQLAARLGPVS